MTGSPCHVAPHRVGSRRVAARWVLALATAVTVTAAVARAADFEPVQRAWLDLLAEEPRLLAPQHTRLAEMAVTSVETTLRHNPRADAVAAITSARAAVAAADSAVRAARAGLGPALAARSAARGLDAEKTLPRDWAAAEALLARAATGFEAGRTAVAARDGGRAKQAYERMRLAAVQSGVLADVQEGMRRLNAGNARKWVPRSYVRALDAVAAAEKLLQARGEHDDAVRKAVATATLEVRHAQYLLDRVHAACESDDPARLESSVLEWEAALARMLVANGIPVDFSAGLGPGLDALEVRSTKLVRERDAERAWSVARGVAVDSLRGTIAALADTVRVREAALDALQRRHSRWARIERLQTLFEPHEGRVLVDGPDIVLRLDGVGFASGTATLRTDSAPLLDKVAAALSEFPGARIIVEADGDGAASPEAEQKLSQERADAVRAALIERAQLAPAQIVAAGRAAPARPGTAPRGDAGQDARRRLEVEIIVSPAD